MTQQIINLTVADWLTLHGEHRLVKVAPDAALCDVLKEMLDADSRDAYVVSHNRVIGHLGFNKLLNHLFSEERPVHSHRQLFAQVTLADASEIMDPHFTYCRENERINDILHRQLQCDVSDLVVLAADNSPIGVVKLTDMVRESLL